MHGLHQLAPANGQFLGHPSQYVGHGFPQVVHVASPRSSLRAVAGGLVLRHTQVLPLAGSEALFRSLLAPQSWFIFLLLLGLLARSAGDKTGYS